MDFAVMPGAIVGIVLILGMLWLLVTWIMMGPRVARIADDVRALRDLVDYQARLLKWQCDRDAAKGGMLAPTQHSMPTDKPR